MHSPLAQEGKCCIMQALIVCEAAQKRSTVFAATRIACLALYGLLGAAGPAAANFEALAIKFIQHDTVTGELHPHRLSLPDCTLWQWGSLTTARHSTAQHSTAQHRLVPVSVSAVALACCTKVSASQL